jgi:hypothetical protein
MAALVTVRRLTKQEGRSCSGSFAGKHRLSAIPMGDDAADLVGRQSGPVDSARAIPCGWLLVARPPKELWGPAREAVGVGSCRGRWLTTPQKLPN